MSDINIIYTPVDIISTPITVVVDHIATVITDSTARPDGIAYVHNNTSGAGSTVGYASKPFASVWAAIVAINLMGNSCARTICLVGASPGESFDFGALGTHDYNDTSSGPLHFTSYHPKYRPVGAGAVRPGSVLAITSTAALNAWAYCTSDGNVGLNMALT